MFIWMDLMQSSTWIVPNPYKQMVNLLALGNYIMYNV